MSTVKANNVQVGQSGTATNNFTLYQPSSPDGTVRLAVGNSGATTGDVLSVSSTGLSVTGTLTSTGVNTFPAGSASAPSITTTGDTNTGVFFPAADTAAITTGGTERMRITSGGDVQIANGNLVISTSGKGIDFSATPGTGTSELLADYEEGTFTPTDASGAGLTLTTARGRYTKIGREVTCYIVVTFPSTASGSSVAIGGLPFTSANPYGSGDAGFGGSISYTNTSSTFSSFLAQNSTTATFYTNAGAGVLNTTFSTKETQFILRYFT